MGIQRTRFMNKEACKWYGKWWCTLNQNGVNNVCGNCTDKEGCKEFPKILQEVKQNGI